MNLKFSQVLLILNIEYFSVILDSVVFFSLLLLLHEYHFHNTTWGPQPASFAMKGGMHALTQFSSSLSFLHLLFPKPGLLSSRRIIFIFPIFLLTFFFLSVSTYLSCWQRFLFHFDLVSCINHFTRWQFCRWIVSIKFKRFGYLSKLAQEYPKIGLKLC